MAEQHEATSPPISNPSFATMTEQQGKFVKLVWHYLLPVVCFIATSADVVQVQNLMKDILQEQDYPLQVALHACLPGVVAEMFSNKMIPEFVKDDPTYNKVIGECKAGMGWLKDVPALQTYWQLFLKILSNQINPAVQGAARYLDTELRDRLIDLDSGTIQNPCTSPSIEADVIKTIESAKVGHDKAAKFLKFGTNTNVALYEAAKADDNEAAQFLLNLGASIDIALLESAKVGHGKAAQFLLNLGASTETALLESAKVNHDKAALFLLKFETNTNVALYEAAKGDDNEAAQFLLNLGASIDIALLESAKVGHGKAAQFLLNLGASAEIALLESAKVNHDKAALFLLKLEANTNIALYEAAKGDDNEIAKFLITLGANKDIALLESAKVGHDKVAQFLIKLGANTDVALYEAAKGDDNKAARFLINFGASTTISLLESAKVNHDKAAQCLLKLGANTNVALFEAAKGDDNDAVQFLSYLGSSTDAGQCQLKKIMKDLLQEQHHSLQLAFRNILPQVAAKMYSSKMIPESVKDNPNYDKLIDEFKAGIEWQKNVLSLQKYWQSFLEILSSQGGAAAQGAADYLDTELSKKLRSLKPAAIQSTYTFSSIEEDVKTIELDSEVIVLKQIHNLHQAFAGLMRQVRAELIEEIQNQTTKTCLSDIAGYVQVYISWESLDFSHIDDLDGLFKELHRFYDFLDCDIIVAIAKEYLTNSHLSKKLQNHSKEAIEFRNTQSVKTLRNGLMQIYNPHLKNPENAPISHIKLKETWNEVHIEGLYLLIKHFLPKHEKQSLLNHIDISAGSVIIKYIVRESQVDHLIAYAQDKLQFMRLIGMSSLVINDTPILADEDENKNFTFDVALLEASKVGCIEAGQFLLELGASVNTALLKALQDDKIEAVSVLMELGGNIDDALLEAAKHGQTDAVQFLQELGASVNIALLKAVQLGHTGLVKLLLTQNADVNIQTTNRVTALMLASLNGFIEVAELLINADADVNIQEKNGVTALMLACQNGHTKVAELLLKENTGVNIQDINGWTATMIASVNGHIEIAELLLKADADVNIQETNGVTALMLTSENGYTTIAELLLKEKADVNIQEKKGWTALMKASKNGHTAVAELLLKADADVNIQGKNGVTALMLASEHGHPKMAEQLLKQNADVNIQAKNGFFALMLASLNGHTQVAELLLKNNADINIQTKNGWTSLMIASQNGHTHVVELLLKADADVNIQDEDGLTALMLASQKGDTQVIELLLNANTDVNIQAKNGVTALMIASQNGHAQVVELLVKELVDIDVQEKSRRTALMLASINGHLQVAECLLQSHADPHIISYNGATAFSLAAYSGNRDLVNMLLDKAEPTTDEIEKAVVLSCYGGHPSLITFLSNELPHLTNDQRELLDSCVKGDLGVIIMKTLDHPDTPLVLGLTPLMVASSCGHVDIVDALIQARADVNKQESHLGLTPLFFAVRGSKSAFIVETLLMYGASPNIIAATNETPLDVATKDSETFEMDELLIKYGGQTTLQSQGGNKSEPKTSFLTFDELKTTPKSLQTTQNMSIIKLFENKGDTIKSMTKQEYQVSSSFIDLVT